MKRIINICLLLGFQIGFLQWGKDKSLFIFQAEAEIFLKARQHPETFFHPFILLPFFGQLIILYCIIKQPPGRLLNLIGLACMSLIMLLLLFIGLAVPNFKILGSTIPFIIAGIFVLKYNWKRTGKVQS